MSQRVFITGATGFIGSRFAHRLVNHNLETHITTRASSNLWRINEFQQRLIIHNLDLFNQEAMFLAIKKIKPDYVFNFACYGGFNDENNHVTALHTNVIATHTLLEACAQNHIKHFIHIGSSSEYGIQPNAMSEVCRENPNSIYGITKLAATHLARWYAKERSLPTTIIRVFSPYGSFDDPRRLIPSVIRACLKKKDIQLGSGRQVRDYIYIEDLIDALMNTLDKAPGNGEIINIGSGKQHSIAEVVDTIVEICGRPMKPLWNALPDRQNEPDQWVADITNAARILAWQPKTTLIDGLAATIDWMKRRWKTHESI